MNIEFVRDGKVYQCAVSPAGRTPPPTFHVVFKPHAPAPAFLLKLAWVATDEARMIELYEPIKELL